MNQKVIDVKEHATLGTMETDANTVTIVTPSISNLEIKCIVDGCSPNTCKNSGDCSPLADSPYYDCRCTIGWGGYNCSEGTLDHDDFLLHDFFLTLYTYSS